MQAVIVIFEIYLASTLIPLGIFFLTRKHQQPAMRYLAAMLMFSFLVDGYGLLNFYWLHWGKVVVVNNFYGYLEIIMVVILYQTQLSPEKKLPLLVTNEITWCMF